jgi:hypothetical protein
MFTPDRLASSAFYGALTVVMLMLAWRSKSNALLEIGMWIATAWAIDTIAFYVFGPRDEPFIAPTIDAMIAAMIGGVAIRYHSRIAWSVVAIFVLSGAAVVAGFLAHSQGSWLYFLVLNVLFAARLLVTGGAAVHDMVLRTHPGRRRFALHGLRRTSRSSRITKT